MPSWTPEEREEFEIKMAEFKESRERRMKALENMDSEQWETLGLVSGVLRDLVHHMRLMPVEADYHNRDNWHPLHAIWVDFDKHMCLDDYNNNYLYSEGWEAHFRPYEHVKKWR